MQQEASPHSGGKGHASVKGKRCLRFSRKQRRLNRQAATAPALQLRVRAEETLETPETNRVPSTKLSSLQPPPTVYPEGLSMGAEQNTGPR